MISDISHDTLNVQDMMSDFSNGTQTYKTRLLSNHSIINTPLSIFGNNGQLRRSIFIIPDDISRGATCRDMICYVPIIFHLACQISFLSFAKYCTKRNLKQADNDFWHEVRKVFKNIFNLCLQVQKKFVILKRQILMLNSNNLFI